MGPKFNFYMEKDTLIVQMEIANLLNCAYLEAIKAPITIDKTVYNFSVLRELLCFVLEDGKEKDYGMKQTLLLRLYSFILSCEKVSARRTLVLNGLRVNKYIKALDIEEWYTWIRSL